MINLLCRLYADGKLKSGGLFEKTADMITRNELDKYAGMFDYFTKSTGPMHKRMIKHIVRTSTDPKTMLDALTKLRQLTPGEQEIVAEHALGGAGSIWKKIKARISSNPLLAKGVGVGGAIGALGLGSHISDKVKAKKQDTAEEFALKNILKRNPDFDKKKATELFSVLQDLAPTIAANPTAAEGFVQPHMQWPTLPYTAVKDLTQIEKNLADAQSRDQGLFAEAFSEVGGALAALLSLGS